MNSVVGVIPARYASTRFPGKPLALINGRPMIEWVYDAASKGLPQVVVATDDERIFQTVRGFGGRALMTPASLASGTERMAFAAKKLRASYYVNIQGDEPLIKPETIRAAVKTAVKRKSIATPVADLDEKDFNNPNVVKAAVGKDGRALYFSRSLVPYPREKTELFQPLKHIGLYVFPRKVLFKFMSLKPSPLEKIEMLEQLRALYYGMPIYTVKTRFDSAGVDTPADLEAVQARLHLLISNKE